MGRASPNKGKIYIKAKIGLTSGSITVISEEIRKMGKAPLAKCICECDPSKELWIRYYDITSQKIKRCKYCYLRKDTTFCPESSPEHKRLHKIWDCMYHRCYNEKHNNYHLYGGRGIKICQEWADCKNFCTWALSNGYADNLEIDRKDVDGNYEPSNCRWITHAQNSYNVRQKPPRGTGPRSKYKGVCWDKSRNKWCAEIRKDYKKIFIGRFDLERDAAEAYNQRAKELFGEFAYLNIIED